jgi:hypothetical protein
MITPTGQARQVIIAISSPGCRFVSRLSRLWRADNSAYQALMWSAASNG